MKKFDISAEIVEDSINQFGDRITTMVLTYPRSIHAELMTHRVFSRNAASSRAVPYLKLKDSVVDGMFLPYAYQKSHSGMQGSVYHDLETTAKIEKVIVNMRNSVIADADKLHNLGVTKQVINRYLEPYQYYRVLVTSTEWSNFIGLRAHEDAEIHIAELGEKVLDALNSNTPRILKPGEWHLPFGDRINEEALERDSKILNIPKVELRIKIAIARCARVSYDNFNHTKDDYVKDAELFDKLFASVPIHASPAEHAAYAMSYSEYITNVRGELTVDMDGRDKYTVDLVENWSKLGWCRNFKGFIQYRELLPNDTILNDDRIVKYMYTDDGNIRRCIVDEG